MKTPPVDPCKIKKWKDIFLSEKDSLNNQLLGLIQHLNKYNEALSDMSGSMAVGDEFAPYEDKCTINAVADYDVYANSFYNCLKTCEVPDDNPLASSTHSRDSSPAGAAGGSSRGLGKFVNMSQLDPGELTVDLDHAGAKKYLEKFRKYMFWCYPGGFRLEDYKHLLSVRIDCTYDALIGKMKEYKTEADLKAGV